MDPQSSTTGGKKSHMLRNIIVIVVILLVVGGIVAYFVTKNDNPSTTQPSQSSNQAATTQAKTFAPAVNSNQPYSATVSTDTNGQQKSATLISDGQGNYSYTYQAKGQSVSIIYTPDAYYLCTGTTTCIRYATSSTSSSGFDPSTYQYDSTKIENLKNTAAYKGQQTCPSGTGTCDIWSVSSNNTTSTLYVDSASKKIVKATYSSGTTSSDVTYEYKNVHIAVPTNYTTAPAQ